MEEIWREIKDFNHYYISNYGRLKSVFPHKKEKFLKPIYHALKNITQINIYWKKF